MGNFDNIHFAGPKSLGRTQTIAIHVPSEENDDERTQAMAADRADVTPPQSPTGNLITAFAPHIGPDTDQIAALPGFYGVDFPRLSQVGHVFGNTEIAPEKRGGILVIHWTDNGKKDGNSVNLYSSEENARYAQFMAKRIEDTARKIRAGEMLSFGKVLEEATKSRLQSALIARGMHEDEALRLSFDNLAAQDVNYQYEAIATSAKGRTTNLNTHLGGHYAGFIPEIEHKLRQLLHENPSALHICADGFDQPSLDLEGSDGSRLYLYKNGSRTLDYWHSNSNAVIKGSVHVDPENLDMLRVNSATLTIVALSNADHAKLFLATSDAYNNALRSTDPQSARESALKGYWNAMQINTNNRASSSIAEYAYRAMLLAKGIDEPLLERGKTLDLPAALYSLPEFVARSSEIFASEAS